MDPIEKEGAGEEKKRRGWLKILCGIVPAALACLLLVSLFFFRQEWQEEPGSADLIQSGTMQAPTGTAQGGASAPPETAADPGESTAPADPTGETQGSVPPSAEPTVETQAGTAPAADPTEETGGGTVPTDPNQDEPTGPEKPTKPTEPPAEPTEGPKATDPIPATEPSTPGEPEDDRVLIDVPAFNEEVYLVGEAVKDYLNAENVESVSDFLAPYWNTGTRLDIGSPAVLSYQVRHLPEGVSVKKAVFRISASADFKHADVLEAADTEQSVRVYNLLPGRKYYYQVTVTLSDGSSHTRQTSFKTAATPRLLNIDGIVNVRDIGGWKTTDGKTVRHGLLYRGSELDGFVEPEFRLTEKGREQLRNLLKIRTDMDLRHAGEDMLGPDVRHVYYCAIQYGHIFTEAGSEAVRRVFSDLSDPDNYPVYMHCTYGADRTGTMCYLLEGLLGVSDADLIRDYELTALYFGYVSPEEMDAFIQKLGTYPGETTQQKVESYLLSIGVTQQQIDSIRQIFLT